MKHLFITILLLLPLCRMLAQEREYVIVVHGGAGAMENLEDDKEKSTLYYAALDFSFEHWKMLFCLPEAKGLKR